MYIPTARLVSKIDLTDHVNNVIVCAQPLFPVTVILSQDRVPLFKLYRCTDISHESIPGRGVSESNLSFVAISIDDIA